LFRCEAIVDFEVHSRLTTVFALLTCAQNRVGFYTTASFWRRDIATHLLFYHPANGVYEFYDQVTRLFGGITVPFENASAAFLARMGVVPARDPECTRIGVAPGCSDLSKERMLEFADWATVLARQLERVPPGQKAEVHLLGGPGDQETTARIGTALRQEYADVPVFDHAGKLSMQDSVRQLATLTTVVCIDSALQHFARLLGLSVVSFWGPTDPSVLLRPRRGNRDEVNYYKLSCSPCVHMAHQPPCKGNNICMGYAVDPSRAGERNPIWLAQTTRTSQR